MVLEPLNEVLRVMSARAVVLSEFGQTFVAMSLILERTHSSIFGASLVVSAMSYRCVISRPGDSREFASSVPGEARFLDRVLRALTLDSLAEASSRCAMRCMNLVRTSAVASWGM
jgi:hypothetical protein